MTEKPIHCDKENGTKGGHGEEECIGGGITNLARIARRICRV